MQCFVLKICVVKPSELEFIQNLVVNCFLRICFIAGYIWMGPIIKTPVFDWKEADIYLVN